MSIKRAVKTVVVGCVVVVLFAVPGFAAQQQPAHQHPAAAKAKVAAKPAPAMEAKCQAMMAGHNRMMADMTAADQRLDALLATMNTTSMMDKEIGRAHV